MPTGHFYPQITSPESLAGILKWILLLKQSGRLSQGSAGPRGTQIPPTMEGQLLGKKATLKNAIQIVPGPNEQQPAP